MRRIPLLHGCAPVAIGIGCAIFGMTPLSATEIPGEVIAAQAEACIDSLAADAKILDRSVECTSIPRSRQVPCGRLHTQSLAPLAGPGLYMVRLLDCEERAVATVAVRLEAFANLLCATTDIAHGAPLATDNTAPRRTRLDPRGLPELPADKRFRARRRLVAGTLIRSCDIEPIPEILAGDRVSAYLERGGLRIAISGRALEDGVQGELFMIHDPATRRALRARVLGPGKARLEP